MTEVICSTIGAVSAIICAYVARQNKLRDKAEAERNERSERRAAQRAKESLLNMKMLAAESDLTIGVAMALKRGYTNGDLDAGIIAVKEARQEYESFLEEIAAQHLNK